MADRLTDDCLEHLFAHIDPEDLATLHSALLVCRAWCRAVAPIIWRKPFSEDAPSIRKIVPIFLHFLPPKARSLEAFGGRLLERTPPTFVYPSFLRELDYKRLSDAVLDWRFGDDGFDSLAAMFRTVEIPENEGWGSVTSVPDGESCWSDISDTAHDAKFADLEGMDGVGYYSDDTLSDVWSDEEHDKLSYDDEGDLGSNDVPELDFEKTIKGVTLTITREICKVIVNLSPVLHKLVVNMHGFTSKYLDRLVEYVVIPSFPGAQRCLPHLRELVYAGGFVKTELVNGLARVVHNIEELRVAVVHHAGIRELADLISVQRKLRVFTFQGDHDDMSLIPRALQTQAGSLTEVEFRNGFFGNNAAFSGLAACSNLKTLRLVQCHVQSCHLGALADAPSLNLESLDIADILDIWNEIEEDEDYEPPVEGLLRLIVCVGPMLRELRLNVQLYYYDGLLDTIALGCPNLVVFAAIVTTDDHATKLYRVLSACVHLEELLIPAQYGARFAYFPADEALLGMTSAALPQTLRRLELTKWILSAGTVDSFLGDHCSRLAHLSWQCCEDLEKYSRVVREYAARFKRTVLKMESAEYESQRRRHRQLYDMCVEFG